jgi:hypothetical protein
MKLEKIIPLPKDKKYKYIAYFYDPVSKKTKSTRFGAKGYEDYTIHKDINRRQRYRLRHEKDLKTNDPTRAGYLSYYILWGDSTSLQKNISIYKKKFNL